MKVHTPRLRMFAGPNGSGKSTVKAQIDPGLWGRFVNADEIEAALRKTGSFVFDEWNIHTSKNELRDWFENSWVAAKRPNWKSEVADLNFENNRLQTANVALDSYFAAVLAEFLRVKLIEQKVSFTFETVMSDASKVRFLREAQSAGYRTYLYYVATRDPLINLSRVANRVQNGGHPVPDDKIIERYWRSLDLLWPAIEASDRAYLWDNSGSSAQLFAEFDQNQLIARATQIPNWFLSAVLDKMLSQ